jgi:RNA polymerase sigma-70 factor (ECF subfamily)
MRPTSANGQPAAACYTRDTHGVYRGYGIVALTVTREGVRGILSFGDAGLLGVFGLPPVWCEYSDRFGPSHQAFPVEHA